MADYEEYKPSFTDDASELDDYESVARIVVIGVGGAGNNAVNRMIDEKIRNVTFHVMNTDKQALATSKAPYRHILGNDVTEGLGAGGDPEMGRKAAEASEERIREIVKDAHMVFIAAGMGGGTGTGAAPVIARITKEMKILTIAIVTRPFGFEGKKRIANSVKGLNELRDSVDSIIVVSNDKLLMSNGTSAISDAFSESDRILAQSVKTVTDLIVNPAIINLDFADVRNTLSNSGVALIGFGEGDGPNKAQDAAVNAITCPLLETGIRGARRAICHVTCGPTVSLYEAQDTVERIIEAAGETIDVKFGVSINDKIGDKIFVSVIASDFEEQYDFEATAPKAGLGLNLPRRPEPTPTTLNEDKGGLILESPSVEEPAEEEKEPNLQEEDFGENFLPDFLKSKNIE